MSRAKDGFTLTEILVVVVVFGITIGLFNTVFINNWFAYEDRIKRANLWSETNQLFEQMSFDGRNSRLIAVTNTAAAKVATFTNAVDNSILTYTIDNTGTITRVSGADSKIFSTHAIFANSNFTINGNDLIADLYLQDDVYSRNIHITSSTEILPRN